MRILSAALALAALACVGVAQSTHVIPNGLASTEGDSSNNFPWTNASAWPGLRTQTLYDSGNFTAAGINYPILITRLRWRANGSAASWTGGTITQATVKMSTGAVDYASMTSTMASNTGADEVIVHSGAVTYQGGTGNGVGVPGPWVVDLPLQSPFVYVPASGDLLIDVDFAGAASAGLNNTSLDVQTTGSLTSRAWSSTNYPNPNGSQVDHGVVVEVTYSRVRTATTVFASNNGGSSGGGVYFDVDVDPIEGVLVRGLGLNSSATAGSVGSVDVYIRRGTSSGFEQSPAGWRQVVAAAPCVLTAADKRMRVAFPPFLLPKGTWGLAVSVSGAAFSTGQRYTDGANVYTDGCLTITTGTANNTLFTAGLFTPRTWNGDIYYVPASREVPTLFNGGTIVTTTPGTGIYFDAVVHHTAGVHVSTLEFKHNTAGADTISIWQRLGTAAGNEQSPAGWRQVANAVPFTSLGSSAPSLVCLPVPLLLVPGTNGLALSFGTGQSLYTAGNGSNENHSDGIVDVQTKSSSVAVLGAGTVFSPRVWNGFFHYQILDPDLVQFQFNEPYDTTLGNSAPNTALAREGSVNTIGWQGDPGRPAFRGNEPGAGMLARATAANTNLGSINWSALSGSMTIMWWHRMGTSAPPSTAYSCGSSSGSERIFTGGVAGTSLAYRGSPIGDVYGVGSVQGSPGTWQHAALVVDDDAGRARWYLDGVLDMERTFTPHTHGVAGAAFHVGYGTSTSTTFTLYYDMDDFRIFNRALNEGEVWNAMLGENASAGTYGRPCGAGTISSRGGLPSATSGNPGFAVQLSGSNPSQLFVNVLGFLPRATSPVNIAPFFGPGCFLQTQNSSVVFGLTSPAGNGTVSLPVPRNPGLVGLHVYSQFIVFPLGAGAATHGLDLNIK